jgi:hypothetical protein
MNIPTGHDQFRGGDGKPPVKVCSLGQICGPVVAGTDGISEEPNHSADWRKQPGYRLEQGALASSIRPDQGNSLPDPNCQRNTGQCQGEISLVPHRQLFDVQSSKTGQGVTMPATAVRPPGLMMMVSEQVQRRASTMV